jgi:hypothetical protein
MDQQQSPAILLPVTMTEKNDGGESEILRIHANDAMDNGYRPEDILDSPAILPIFWGQSSITVDVISDKKFKTCLILKY